jgi:predicted Zn-dependent protease
MRRLRSLGGVALFGLLAARASLAQVEDRKKEPDQIGKRLAGQVERQAKFVRAPEILEYVNRIGQNLVRNSDTKTPFNIKIIDSEEVNAFGVPGGFFFVNSGLILKAESEAELAGVLAHEIAHVEARHGPRQASKTEPAQYLSIPLTFLKFSRSFEVEADRLGLEYMHNARYDPAACVNFFQRLEILEQEQPGTVAQVFWSHLMTSERIKASQKNIQEYLKAKPGYVVSTSEFEEVKARLMALTARHKPEGQEAERPRLRKQPGREDLTNLAQPAKAAAR